MELRRHRKINNLSKSGVLLIVQRILQQKGNKPEKLNGRDIRNGTFISCKVVPNSLYILLTPYCMHTSQYH